MAGRARKAERRINARVRQLAGARSVAYSNLRSSLEKLERAHSEIVTFLDSRMSARVVATSRKHDAIEQSKRQEIEDLREKLGKLPAGASREGPEKKLADELGLQRLQQTVRRNAESMDGIRNLQDGRLVAWADQLVLAAADAPFKGRKAEAFLSALVSGGEVLVGAYFPAGALVLSGAQIANQLRQDLSATQHIRRGDRAQLRLENGQKIVEYASTVFADWTQILRT